MMILVYGGGAVGLGIASCLLKAKAQVNIIARENTVNALREHGLVRTGLFGDYHANSTVLGSFISLDELAKKTYDYILVCVKSFDSPDAAEDLANHKFLFGEETKIVLFQNGWGNAEIFTRLEPGRETPYFNKDKIFNARVITGFKRIRANEVAITVHADAIHIGSLFGACLSNIEKLCELITKGGIACQTTNEIEKDLWAKMLYNCALNSLSAILDVPYGMLAKNEFGRAIMNGIIEEIFDCLTAAGYRTHWPSAKDFQEVFYNKLVPDTAGQKGTGKWTVVAALDSGQPLTLISEAVLSRCLSALKDERVAASQ
ncbi:MAG: 2-dehydropantoate 2-reductase, partial [Sedimentisphaerales bacterium]|nr:2-dehydropantoate 2-reductase [Sedimentisphaerales bacterium]